MPMTTLRAVELKDGNLRDAESQLWWWAALI
jgi:hypothetical protein